jgi:hypothetical protein
MAMLEQSAEAAKSLAFEELWATMDRLSKEADRRHKETERIIKKNGRQLGELNNRFGEMAEHMVRPNLVKKLKRFGFAFTKAGPNVKIADREHNIFAEVDTCLENGLFVMAVEVKVKPNVKDIDDHVERMEKLRRHALLHGDSRIYLGGIAGVVFSESNRLYARRKGFYVMVPSGKTFDITAPGDSLLPCEWEQEQPATTE